MPGSGALTSSGCTMSEVQKLSVLGRGAMKCAGINLPEMIGFMRSMSREQTQNLNLCSDNSTKYEEQCYKFYEWFTAEAANKPSSTPARFVNHVYSNPPQVQFN
jgi:hypothetical protein